MLLKKAEKRDPSSKILDAGACRKLVERARSRGEKIVFTNGCFDIIHRGHCSYLKQAASYGDLLIVGLNSDASVRRLKGEGRPLNPQADRAYVLASLEVVDAVVVFDGDTPKELIEELSPHVLVKGSDYTVEQIAGAEWVLSHGGEVKLIPLVEGRSTTSLLERIRKRQEER